MPSKQPPGARPEYSSGTSDIFVLIAVVLLAASLALAAGVFLYDKFLDTNVQKKSEQLERARAAFEPALIQELLRLDARLVAAEDVLNNHLAPSAMFALLEELTLKSVEFRILDYQVNDDSSITIHLEGKAASVNGVALQASVFGQHNAISNPIFSDLDIVSDGVTFEVTTQISPQALRYVSVATFLPPEPIVDDFSEFETFDEPLPVEEFGEFGGSNSSPSEL